MKSRNEIDAAVVDAFSVYHHNLIHWFALRVAGGDPDQMKAAKELVDEARQDLVNAIFAAAREAWEIQPDWNP
jgi:hypothetical protein